MSDLTQDSPSKGTSMTKDEEILLRELAGGRCTIQKVTAAIGPMSLWSKAGLEAEIRKAVEAEREACAKVCEEQMRGESDMPLYLEPQREWVGLTEQQIKSLLSDSKCWIGDDCSMPNLTYIIRAVEKAHGIGEK